MARRIVALAAIGLLALATICILSSFVLGVSPLDLSMPVFEPDSTPEEAARRSVCAQGVPRNFRVHGTRSWERGVIVLYSARCPSPPDAPIPEPEIPVSGFRLLEDGLFGWRVVLVGSAGDGKEARSGQLVSYRPGGGRGGRLGSYGYVSGRVLAPDKVRAVEAIFDNGRVMRDDAPGELFALFSLGTGGRVSCGLWTRTGRYSSASTWWGKPGASGRSILSSLRWSLGAGMESRWPPRSCAGSTARHPTGQSDPLHLVSAIPHAPLRRTLATPALYRQPRTRHRHCT